ncbi:hypothetical protein [Carboxylicivirga taeanensis]|uniref:hypothetical protein n=1 Tax=Carboxylicivirga taeanensis TaxID=1416875 RepID=UPI003F6E0E8E
MLNQLKDFYQKNRLFIISGLALVLLLQICSRGARKPVSTALPDTHIQADTVVNADTLLKPLQEIYYEEKLKNSERNPEITHLFLLMGLVLLVFVATKRGWLQKLTPSIVWVSIKARRKKETKERVATISISNYTKESLTISSPILILSSPSKKARKFKVKGSTEQNIFPLTLMPGTAHHLTINLDTFRQKAGIKKGFRWMKVKVNTDKRTHSSVWKYLF